MSKPNNDDDLSSSSRLRNGVGITFLGLITFTAFTRSSTNIAARQPINPVEYSKSMPRQFHQSGFGGIHNINHPAGARARRNLAEADVIIPTSAVEHAIPSLSRENIENLHGHYVHDEHRSPFASHLYDRPKEELEAEQKDYEKRMSEIREEWGAWDFNDEHLGVRPIANFDAIPYKDMENGKFSAKSWQMDQKYCTDLIAESKKLVNRVREAIYAEYGHPTKALKTEEEIAERNKLFEIHITEKGQNPGTPNGWAFITKNGLDMYARKLLHSMMTNDEFYYVLGGHSSAAGHGNHFHQTYLMEFANIMEPLLHKLGVRLIARNLAMGGLGTFHFSLASGDLYGETDVLAWDSSMTEKDAGDQDLFHKAAMLGGERIPILLGGHVNDLEVETGGNLWYGDIFTKYSGVPVITDIDQADEVPFAVQHFLCDNAVKDLCDRGMLDQCWVPRTDVKPEVAQNEHVGGKASWHPGFRQHKYTARKHTMLMLKALDRALEMWEQGIAEKGFPLKEEYWHIGPIYTTSRSTFTTYINGDGLNKSACEKRLAPLFGLDRACRMQIRGITEFNGKNRGDFNSIIPHIKAASNGYKPHLTEEPLYEGIDILPPIWKLPEGEIDVHAITIASTYAAPELDNSLSEKDESTESSQNSRRLLRQVSTELPKSSIEDDFDVANKNRERSLVTYTDNVVPGEGWDVLFTKASVSTGYCDGSPMSTCKRSKGYTCLLYGHNDDRIGIMGDGLSGWLVVTLPELKEGLVFARMEDWHPRNGELKKTMTWSEVNDGMTDGEGRELKRVPPPWPEDFMIDIAVNGKIHKSYTKEEWYKYAQPIAYNNAMYPLVDDKSFVGSGAIEIGIRLRSESNPRNAGMNLSHIYFA